MKTHKVTRLKKVFYHNVITITNNNIRSDDSELKGKKHKSHFKRNKQLK